MTRPALSVILLTWNEEANIRRCLQALGRQTFQDMEVIVIDANSSDGTVDEVDATTPTLSVPVRLITSDHRVPIGEARNLGVAQSRAGRVAFLSADAEPADHWAERLMASLRTHQVVFGRQFHAPDRWSIGASVRGLRYHFPDRPTSTPGRYASNVAAGYHRRVLERFPFDPDANAAEDLILARKAEAAGYTITYDPKMVVHHHDVVASRQEMRKCVREGHGCGRYAGTLGGPHPILGWGAVLGLAAATAFWRLDVAVVALTAALWLPAVRRALRPHPEMPLRARMVGLLASPPFDLAFLFSYLKARIARVFTPRTKTIPRQQETDP